MTSPPPREIIVVNDLFAPGPRLCGQGPAFRIPFCRLTTSADAVEDGLRIYRCGAKLEIVGLGVVTEDPKVCIV